MLLALLLACAHAAPPPVAAPPAPPAATALPPDCPHGAPDPAARQAQGEALVAASLVGEHHVGWDYLWGLQALREAADAGYPPALYSWGRLRFGALYLDAAPDPDSMAERQAMILALAALGSAARLGHAEAATALPDDVMQGLLSTEPFADRGDDPDLTLPDLPTEWLESARQVIDHHRRCWPDPEPTAD